MDNYTIKIAKGLANNADARLIMLLSTQEDIPLQQAGCLTKMAKRTLDVSA